MSGAVLDIAALVAGQPTAPLREHLPRAAARLVAEEAGLPTSLDEAGNLVVGRGERLVLVAHLDHPAFHVDAVEDGPAGAVRLTFRGGVRAGVAGAGDRVVLHRAGDADPVGLAELVDVVEEGGRLRSATATVLEGEAVPGGFAVWDLPAFAVADGRLAARACDDLVGVAAGLAALVAAGDGAARLVCTRGEEVGFLGALEAARLGTVPAGAAVLSLECSKALPHAPQGAGVIVRVGDARTTFEPGLTAALWARAQALEGLVAQRRLMDGGSCEATAFAGRGYAASGLALPLAGYHNMPDELQADGRRVGPVAESVLVADLDAEARLLASLCEEPPEAPGGAWLDELAEEARRLLAEQPLGPA